MQAGRHSDEGNLCPLVFVGDVVERLEDGTCCCCDHAGLNGWLADVDHETVHWWLGWANHVLGGCNKLDDRVIELLACPSVGRLVLARVPVEQLRHFVAQTTHATLPPVTTLCEGDEGIDVHSTPTTTSDHRVGDNWDRVIAIGFAE